MFLGPRARSRRRAPPGGRGEALTLSPRVRGEEAERAALGPGPSGSPTPPGRSGAGSARSWVPRASEQELASSAVSYQWRRWFETFPLPFAGSFPLNVFLSLEDLFSCSSEHSETCLGVGLCSLMFPSSGNVFLSAYLFDLFLPSIPCVLSKTATVWIF